MTGNDDISDIHDCGDDVAAYALGALDPAEVKALRTHLETCIVCRDELAVFQQVAELLPLTTHGQPAPQKLRRRVLEAVTHADKLEPGADPRRGPRGWSVRLSLPRPALALGAVVTVILVAAGGVALSTSGPAGPRVYSAQVAGPGSAEITVSNGRAVLLVHHFSPPAPGEIYEVWLERSGRAPAPTSALFSVTANGDGDVEVPGNLHGVDAVMVTPEPAGGSRIPTHPAVIRAQLS